ncbi:hypothetical protein G432_05065 [Sphingomonas sp. MM-1]|nr:hypothetical protein G432_05065 [Sphingomonas sp. MM-1]
MELQIGKYTARISVLPPIHPKFRITPEPAAPNSTDGEEEQIEAEPISGFTCIIGYTSGGGEVSERLITCRSLRAHGTGLTIGAICHAAKGFRAFRVDRISAVSDPHTGEVIGDGSYFSRFAVKSSDKARAPSGGWGLTPSRMRTLVAGLNVLSFIARCDGYWHALEDEPLANFIERLWMRKDWEGQPPVAAILDHAKRLAPDSSIFFASLETIFGSRSSTRLLISSVRELIEADGIIQDQETNWVLAMQQHQEEYYARKGLLGSI